MRGALLVFALVQDGVSEIYAVRPDGAELTRVTTSQGAEQTSPNWTA